MNTDTPETCDRFGCHAAIQTYCPLCDRFFCEQHDMLPDGHACLSTVGDISNVAWLIDDADEVLRALVNFRRLP